MVTRVLLVDVTKNALAAAPFTRRLVDARRLRHGYDPDKDAADYVREVFDTHASAISEGLDGLHGRVLEIGPGGNLGVGLLMARAGAAQVDCIDSTPWAEEGAEALYDALGRQHLDRVRYLAPVDIHDSGLPAASYDAIYSQACFEHFADPARAVSEIARLLRPGGCTTHQIDLRDHRDFDTPLSHLRHSDLMWRLASSHRGCGGNRWRASDYVEAFRAQGLDVDVQVTTRQDLSAREIRAFHPKFRGRPEGDLESLGIFVVARKPFSAPGSSR